ncbi:MAG: outer membrane lipoprotein carrier protein LolA [Pseudomonas sp.]|nr:outer membrane lipoprotein carrier protein LolA [Pseudomonas sp.]
MKRWPWLLCLLLLSSRLWAFDNEQLAQQLSAADVVRGEFVQEKYLRSLAIPLSSRGQFVLSKQLGLLWKVRQPFAQTYRIDAQGVSLLADNVWQIQPGQNVAARQSRLFLAVLQGDQSVLEADFTLQLQGNAQQWQLQLLPKAVFLQQIFKVIEIHGGALVERIELHETQGDRTVMRMLNSQADSALLDDEQHAFQL